ncbi:oligosaccharide flippase family protein [Rhodococcus sp. X156]|uniref:oligosaccharide flippase family protein n=1 Tax=Rhodococcus sp. X156 TaxID=2499145 RepID=UPI000FD853D1|nr:oligosaccharide flippase family protein [Rhodococcus sp. X156]
MSSTTDHNRAAVSNSVALVLSRVVIAAMGWLGSVLVARALSPEAWGQYSFVFGLLGLLSIITDLGVGRVVLARLVADDEREVSLVAGSYIALRLVLGLLGYLVGLGFVLALGYPGEVVRATAVAGIVVVVATPSHALTVLFQSRLRLTVVAIAESVGQAVQLLLTVLAAVLAPTLLIFVLPVIVNELVKITWKLRAVRRGEAGPLPARHVGAHRWRALLVDALPMTVGAGLGMLLSKIDLLLLSRLDTFDSVGLYSVGYKFADVLDVVSYAVITPVLTLLVRAWPGDLAEFRRRVQESALALAVLGAVSLAVFWAAAEPILRLLYGERFGEAAFASRMLVLGSCFGMLTYLGFMVAVSAERRRAYPLVAVVGLVVNVGLNLVLIPRMSYDGAAIATVATEALVLVLIWTVAARAVRGLVPLGTGLGLVAVTAAVIGLSELLVDVLPWPLVSAGSGLVVLAAAWLLRVPVVRGAPAFVRERWTARRS